MMIRSSHLHHNRRHEGLCSKSPVAISVASPVSPQQYSTEACDVEASAQEPLIGRYLTRKIKSCNTGLEVQSILQTATTPLNATHICSALGKLARMHGREGGASASMQGGAGDSAMQGRQRKHLASQLASSVIAEPLMSQLSPKQVPCLMLLSLEDSMRPCILVCRGGAGRGCRVSWVYKVVPVGTWDECLCHHAIDTWLS